MTEQDHVDLKTDTEETKIEFERMSLREQNHHLLLMHASHHMPTQASLEQKGTLSSVLLYTHSSFLVCFSRNNFDRL